jgi:hypothetical protein
VDRHHRGAPDRGPRGDRGPDPAASLHPAEHVTKARQHLTDFLAELLAEDNDVRTDVPPKELAAYCLHALTAAGAAPSKPAVRRLVAVTLAGLRSQPCG